MKVSNKFFWLLSTSGLLLFQNCAPAKFQTELQDLSSEVQKEGLDTTSTTLPSVVTTTTTMPRGTTTTTLPQVVTTTTTTMPKLTTTTTTSTTTSTTTTTLPKVTTTTSTTTTSTTSTTTTTVPPTTTTTTTTTTSTTTTTMPVTCAHPDTGARVAVGTAYTFYTKQYAVTSNECGGSGSTAYCTSSGQWSQAIPSTRYQSCQVYQKSVGQHCDIGGKWGWRSWNPGCAPGTAPISANLVGGCPEGATPVDTNGTGEIGCYYSNQDPRRPVECSASDPRDECCFWVCSPQGSYQQKWTCTDIYGGYSDSSDGGYQGTWCVDQFGNTKYEYNPPPVNYTPANYYPDYGGAGP